MTRLLVWTENYWIGGCDRFLADLLATIDRDRVDVTLAGNPHPAFDAWLAQRIPAALPRDVVPIANQRETVLRRLAPGPPAGGAGGEPGKDGGDAATPSVRSVGSAVLRYEQGARNALRLRRLLRRHRPDAVLVNNGGYPGGESCRILPLAARAEGIERVVHFVHNMAHPPAWPGSLERRLDRRIDRATHAWATAAHRASAALAAARGIDAARVRTIHYGIPPAEPPVSDRERLRAELGFPPDGLGVAVVANLEPRKGHEVLLEALAAAAPGPRPVHAALVGDGPRAADLRARVAALGLEDRVRLLGWRDDVPAILAASDALALPSLANECLPYAILEAMAARLPVVSTDVAGIPEMVQDGETGRVVAPGDVAALGAALAEIAGDGPRARAMGERGRERVEREFRVERMVERVLALCLHEERPS